MSLDAIMKGLGPSTAPAMTRRKQQSIVAMTVGHRNESGTPVDKDRFFAMKLTPTIDYGKKGRGREPAPEFAAWNFDEKGNPLGRAVFRAVFQYANFHDNIDSRYFCFKPKTNASMQIPGLKPYCTSEDGVKATRYFGADEFREIRCLNQACPLWIDGSCRFQTESTMALSEPGFPVIQFYWVTRSTKNARYIFNLKQELLQQLEALCTKVGLPVVGMNWFGLPVILELVSEWVPGTNNVPPRVKVKLDGALHDILIRQSEAAAKVRALLAAPTMTARQIANAYPDADHLQLSGHVGPARGRLPDDEDGDPIGPVVNTVSERPRALDVQPGPVIEASVVQDGPPPIELLHDVPVDERGHPLCPACSSGMRGGKGKHSWGWACSRRPECSGLRQWNGALIGGA